MKPASLLLCSALVIACGSPGSGGTGGGSSGGGQAGAGGSGGSGGAAGGSTLENPMPCTPGGAASAPGELSGRGVTLSYSSTSLLAPGADVTGSVGGATQVRLGLTAQATNDPPHTELTVFFNGCSVGKLPDVGEEYWWTTRPTDPAISIAAGKHLVIEVVRAGRGVILRRSFALPAVLPKLTAPAAHAAISAPTSLAWDAMTLPAGSKLSVTAWHSSGGGGGNTDGYMLLPDPGAGHATWTQGKASWTSVELTAELKPEPALSFYLSYFVPVN
ncbi:MAG: hypothetical protein IPJ65_36140 [Archangiaceae bacterium]|nr:hypothetical protein [Archangiaceae bacterium]